MYRRDVVEEEKKTAAAAQNRRQNVFEIQCYHVCRISIYRTFYPFFQMNVIHGTGKWEALFFSRRCWVPFYSLFLSLLVAGAAEETNATKTISIQAHTYTRVSFCSFYRRATRAYNTRKPNTDCSEWVKRASGKTKKEPSLSPHSDWVEFNSAKMQHKEPARENR